MLSYYYDSNNNKELALQLGVVVLLLLGKVWYLSR